jgi:error-prone DNA polymerase
MRVSSASSSTHSRATTRKGLRFVELHCKTNFSFLEGASHADELVTRSVELGYGAIAVTDRNTLAGVVRAHGAAKDQGLKLLVGAELHLLDAPPVVVWASNRESYARLSRLLTLGRRRAEKGECRIAWNDLAEHAAGLLAGLPLTALDQLSSSSLGHRNQPTLESVPDANLLSANIAGTHTEWLKKFSDLFGDRGYLLAELFRGVADAERFAKWRQWSSASGVPLVAANDVHYHSQSRLPLADILTAIRLGVSVAEVQGRLFQNAQRHLRSHDELWELYGEYPELLTRTCEVAERCQFSLDELRYEYPEELAPIGKTPSEYLGELTWEGASKRYPAGVPDKVRKLVQYELELIDELRYEAYFLTVWDVVRFARERGILCQGRGSAANSAVCYCLGVTSVDPERSDLLFERFVSRERNEAPDIDIDFEHERREEVLQYLYGKYGRERAGLTAVVITYCARSAVRDVGKALGLSLDRVDALAKQVDGYTRDERFPERCAQVGIDPESPLGQHLIRAVTEIIGFPRHLSQHVGGMVMTRGPLCELAPIENAAMEGRTVIQWDKDDLDELGILKVDCLCLGMLTAIRKCFELLERMGVHPPNVISSPLVPLANTQVATHASTDPGPQTSASGIQSTNQPFAGSPLGATRDGVSPWTLATIPPEDQAVYEMISRADTMGVFQIESRAQMSMLPRLRPQCFYDLVIEVAIVRPGPIQGQMVHPYLRRRNGEEEAVYPNEAIREVLHKTLGVPLFQEQAMRLAVVAAGFTPGEADQLRRAMGAWRRPGIIDQFRLKLLAGMEARGLNRHFAEQVFQQIRGFGEYGFPESHAASFALLVYVSAWLKRYHPAAFIAAILNSQPMGFYGPAQLIRDARDHGVEVRPVDINASDWDCTLEPPTSNSNAAPALRLGFRLLTGGSRRVIESLVAERARRGPYRSVDEVARRTGLRAAELSRLAEADVFRSLAIDRRAALWQTLGQERGRVARPLFAALGDDEPLVESLPELSGLEQVFADYRASGLSLKGHPVGFFRERLRQLGVVSASELREVPANRWVRVAGLVLLRQRPSTAKGITFVTLEDESGVVNLVVRQAIWELFYTVAKRSQAWVAGGKLERSESVEHVVVNRIEDLSESLRTGGSGQPLQSLTTHSRDFR